MDGPVRGILIGLLVLTFLAPGFLFAPVAAFEERPAPQASIAPSPPAPQGGLVQVQVFHSRIRADVFSLTPSPLLVGNLSSWRLGSVENVSLEFYIKEADATGGALILHRPARLTVHWSESSPPARQGPLSQFAVFRVDTIESVSPMATWASSLDASLPSARNDPPLFAALSSQAASPDPPQNYLMLVHVQGQTYLFTLTRIFGPAPEAPVAAAAPAAAARLPTRRGDRVSTTTETFRALVPEWALTATAALLFAIAAFLILRHAPWLGLVAPLFSRFERHELLSHERRSRLFEDIQAEPGIAFGALRERVGLSSGVTQHHLRLLEQHGLVRRVRDGRTTRFYPAGPKFAPPATLAPARRRILDALRAEPGLSTRQLAERLGQRVQSTWEHLRRLRIAGCVAEARAGRAFVWRATSTPQPAAG